MLAAIAFLAPVDISPGTPGIAIAGTGPTIRIGAEPEARSPILPRSPIVTGPPIVS